MTWHTEGRGNATTIRADGPGPRDRARSLSVFVHASVICARASEIPQFPVSLEIWIWQFMSGLTNINLTDPRPYNTLKHVINSHASKKPLFWSGRGCTVMWFQEIILPGQTD